MRTPTIIVSAAAAAVMAGGVLLSACGGAETNAKALPTPPPAAPQASIPMGTQPPVAGALHVNGWAIADIGVCSFATTYQQAQVFLGDPIGPQSLTQDFVFGRLVCDTSKPAGQAVRFAKLGLEHLVATGRKPDARAAAADPVQRELAAAIQAGLDVASIYGAVISPMFACPGGSCQYTEGVLFVWEDGTPETLRWEKLGCLLTPSCRAALEAPASPVERAPEEPTDEGRARWLIGAAVLAVLAFIGGLVTFVRRLGGQASDASF